MTTGEAHQSAGRFAPALDAARRARSLHPYHEPAARLLLLASALSGDAAGALAAYHDFSERLFHDVGEKPSRSLDVLAERIRGNTWRPAATRNLEPEAPLVGRHGAHAEAFASAAGPLRGGSRTTLITGTPGMGRTRLLEECAARLALEGAAVVSARPLAGDADTDWSTLNLLLRSALRSVPGLAGASPDALATLAAVAPDFDIKRSPKPPRDLSQVASALAETLQSAAEEQPVVIAIDDAHLADRTTLMALQGTFERLKASRVALLLTVPEPTEAAPAELLQIRSALGRALPGAVIRLAPLEEPDLADLTQRLAGWCTDDAQRDRLTRRLMSETGGILSSR